MSNKVFTNCVLNSSGAGPPLSGALPFASEGGRGPLLPKFYHDQKTQY